MRWETVVVAQGDGHGATFESSETFSGKCDVAFMHVSGCYNKGIRWLANGTCTHMIGESCDEEGVEITGYDCIIGKIETYRNCIRSVGTGREYNLYVSGAGHNIGQVSHRDTDKDEGGIYWSANRSVLGNGIIDGQSDSSKTGIKVTGSANSIKATINGYNLSGGIGFDFARS